jgi:ribonuclease HI
VGSEPGIYTEWTDAQRAYMGVKGPKYKKFSTLQEAKDWLLTFGISSDGEEAAAPPAKKAKTMAATFAPVDEGVEYLSIWTDGSSLANGRAGATAGVGVFFGEGDKR